MGLCIGKAVIHCGRFSLRADSILDVTCEQIVSCTNTDNEASIMKTTVRQPGDFMAHLQTK
jgi:hypothetical protein